MPPWGAKEDHLFFYIDEATRTRATNEIAGDHAVAAAEGRAVNSQQRLAVALFQRLFYIPFDPPSEELLLSCNFFQVRGDPGSRDSIVADAVREYCRLTGSTVAAAAKKKVYWARSRYEHDKASLVRIGDKGCQTDDWGHGWSRVKIKG